MQTNSPFNGLSPLLPPTSTPRPVNTNIFNFSNVPSVYSGYPGSPSFRRMPSDRRNKSNAVVLCDIHNA